MNVFFTLLQSHTLIDFWFAGNYTILKKMLCFTILTQAECKPHTYNFENHENKPIITKPLNHFVISSNFDKV